MSPEMVTAIASLWKLVVAIAILFLIVFYRDSMKDAIINIKSMIVKKGDTELRIERKEENDATINAIAKGATEPFEAKEEQTEPLSISTEPGQWLLKIVPALLNKKPEEAKIAFENYRAAEIDAQKKLRMEVLFDYYRYIYNNEQQAIFDLQKLSEVDSIKSFVFYYLAQCYRYARSYDNAVDALRKSLDTAGSEEERAVRAESLADLMLEKGDSPDSALAIILDVFKRVKSREYQSPLYSALASIFEKDDNQLLRAIALEKIIALSPNDQNRIFEAAYAQSHAELSPISMANYDTLLRQNPDNSMALNNLGVGAARADMPIHAVDFYRSSSEKHQTLAMANLADLFIEKGFVREADEILKEAQKQADVHTNVAQALATVATRREAEKKRWEETIQIGIHQKSFLQNFADARFSAESEWGNFSGRWKFGPDAFEIIDSGTKISAQWGSNTKRYKLEGEIIGNSAKLSIQKWVSAPWMSNTEKGYFSDGVPGLSYLSSDNRKLYIMRLAKDELEFIELEREEP